MNSNAANNPKALRRNDEKIHQMRDMAMKKFITIPYVV
jgi:hypothetical protein